jgi:low affinity Fe/Cu permease
MRSHREIAERLRHRSPVRTLFDHFAERSSTAAGSPWAFSLAGIVLIVWAVSGPVFGFSDTWQLIINTGTTIVTFLMVFLIQHSQNKDSRALQIKLDELIAATDKANDRLIDIEDLTDDELTELHERFAKLSLTAAPGARHS